MNTTKNRLPVKFLLQYSNTEIKLNLKSRFSTAHVK